MSAIGFPASEAELIEITDAQWAALSSLSGSEVRRAELARAGVASHTIAALYPFSFTECVTGLTPLLKPDTFAAFTSLDESTRLLKPMRDMMHGLNYTSAGKQNNLIVKQRLESLEFVEQLAVLMEQIMAALPKELGEGDAVEISRQIGLLLCLACTMFSLLDHLGEENQLEMRDFFLLTVITFFPTLHLTRA